MVGEVLREGFAVAHRRPGVILLDLLWKLIWLALTLGGLLLVAYSFAARLQWPITNIRAVDAAIAANLLRQFWNDYGGQLLALSITVLFLSILAWFLLEAFFRSRALSRLQEMARGWSRGRVRAGQPSPGAWPALSPSLESGRGPFPFTLFLMSSVLKSALLIAAGMILGLIVFQYRDAATAAAVTFVAFAFLLSVIDTLVRSESIDLLGIDLLRVTAVLGTLFLFEALIGASLLIVLVAGFLSISRPSDALVMLGVTTLVLLLFNFLHSYLLVVRFSAVGIMRRNVVEV